MIHRNMSYFRLVTRPLASRVSHDKVRLLVCRCERPERLTERVTAVPWDQF